jgi:hypothetical protein
MIGGALYGTGRRFADLTADQRMTAMEVRYLPVERRLTKMSNILTVLVALRNSLLLLLSLLQNIHLLLPDANYHSQISHISPILRHGIDSHRRIHIHVPDAVAMQAHLLLLDSHCLGSNVSGPLHQY